MEFKLLLASEAVVEIIDKAIEALSDRLAVSSLESGSLSFRYLEDLGLRLEQAEGEIGGEGRGGR